MNVQIMLNEVTNGWIVTFVMQSHNYMRQAIANDYKTACEEGQRLHTEFADWLEAQAGKQKPVTS